MTPGPGRTSQIRRRLGPSVRGLSTLALAFGAFANAACYSYVPVPLASIPEKEDVRVRVTDDAAARLVRDLGTFSTELDGELTLQSRDSIAVGVSIDRTYRGATVGSTTQRLLLGRSEVLEVRRREFSRGRTVLVTVGTLVGFGVLAAGITQIVDPNGPSDGQTTPPPPPSPTRVPLVRFRIPFP